jgi:hypothetical protein
MINLKLTLAQESWIEASWTSVEVIPDEVVEGAPGTEPHTIEGYERCTEIRHVSYHPTQIEFLRADSELMGSSLEEYEEFLLSWIASYIPPPDKPTTIPQSITPRQARLALLGAGLLSQVESALQGLPEPDRTVALIEWEYATLIERGSAWIAGLGAALGLDAAQIDELFISAANL